MPLKKGKSQKVISENIRELHSGNTYARTKAKYGKAKADKQAIAIAESTARGGKVKGYGGKKLSSKARNALPSSSFALPGRRYPIEDKSHARNALARVSQHGTPAEKAKVRAAVHRKYPGIGGKVRRGIPAGGTPGSADPVISSFLGSSGGAAYGGKVVSNSNLPSPHAPASGSAHPTAHAQAHAKGRW